MSADAKLAKQYGPVHRHSLRADLERRRDVAIRLAGHDPRQDVAFSGSQPVEGWRWDRFDTAAAGDIGDQGRERGGSKLFSQRRSGSELMVAGGKLSFGEAQARVLCSGRPRA